MSRRRAKGGLLSAAAAETTWRRSPTEAGSAFDIHWGTGRLFSRPIGCWAFTTEIQLQSGTPRFRPEFCAVKQGAVKQGAVKQEVSAL